MLLELCIVPLGRGRSISADVADVVKIIEGAWDQLMNVAKNCHGEMRRKTERVITLMKVDDYGERTGRLTAAVESVEKKLGKPVKK